MKTFPKGQMYYEKECLAAVEKEEKRRKKIPDVILDIRDKNTFTNHLF